MMKQRKDTTLPVPAAPAIPADRVSDIMKAFFSGRNPRTLRTYDQALEDFARFGGAPDKGRAIGALLEGGQGRANERGLAYKHHLIERSLAPATINTRLAALRSVVKLARMIGLVNWTLDVENVKSRAYRDTRGPGREAVHKVFEDLAGRQDPKSRRDRAILRLFYDLGLRRGEVGQLNLADVDLERGTVAVLGKGQAEKQLLALPATTKKAIGEWVRSRGAKPGALFVNFDRARKGGRLTGTSLWRIVKAYGLRRPHGLRHTAITEAVKAARAAGLGIEEVRDYSRHADVRTLMIYRDRDRNVQGRLAELVAETA